MSLKWEKRRDTALYFAFALTWPFVIHPGFPSLVFDLPNEYSLEMLHWPCDESCSGMYDRSYTYAALGKGIPPRIPCLSPHNYAVALKNRLLRVPLKSLNMEYNKRRKLCLYICHVFEPVFSFFFFGVGGGGWGWGWGWGSQSQIKRKVSVA